MCYDAFSGVLSTRINVFTRMSGGQQKQGEGVLRQKSGNLSQLSKNFTYHWIVLSLRFHSLRYCEKVLWSFLDPTFRRGKSNWRPPLGLEVSLSFPVSSTTKGRLKSRQDGLDSSHHGTGRSHNSTQIPNTRQPRWWVYLVLDPSFVFEIRTFV